MKKTRLILISLFFLIGCKVNPESEKIALLQGAWFQVDEDNAAFLIKEKSLLFFEDTTQYKIQLKEKSLEVREGDTLFTTYQIIKLDHHSLWLKTMEGGTLKLLKKK